MRGYSYQILRSIETWLDLRDGEMLVLEGAEDLDRIGQDGVVVEQVKDIAGSGNVTLRSQSVLEAIGNFWEHLQRNPGTSLCFRFLTTANVGQERGRPFNVDDPGIELWRCVQSAPDSPASGHAAAAIQAFLRAQDMLPIGLRSWLESTSPADFVDRIVLRMEWITGTPDWSSL